MSGIRLTYTNYQVMSCHVGSTKGETAKKQFRYVSSFPTTLDVAFAHSKDN